jgi:hypothetical protein
MLSQPVVDVIAAFNTVGVKDFNKVAGAADFASAKEDLKNPPAAYVIPLDDAAKPNDLLYGTQVEQHVIERFGVILAIRNLRDIRGDAVNVTLETLRNKTIAGLLGFVPTTGYDPVQYGGGKLLLLDLGTTWWQLNFITGYYERNY